MNFKFYQLYRSLKEVVGIEKAKIIFPEYDSLPDKMTKVEQINMARILMKRLDDEFEEDVVLDIRMKHPCGIPKDIKEQIIKIKRDLGNKDDPIEALMKY